MSLKKKYWFVAHIDRHFETNMYGNGPSLYTNMIDNRDNNFNIKYYVPDNDGIKIITDCNKELLITGNPSKKRFEEDLYQKWQLWDEMYGSLTEDNRPDYKPLFYEDIDSIKNDLVIK